MPLEPAAIVLAVAASALMGFSKTGLPAASIAAVALMAAAFYDNAQLSVGAMLPILLVGDVFAVAWLCRHAQWEKLWALFPYVIPGMIPAYFVLEVYTGNQLRPILGWLLILLLCLELARLRLRLADVPNRWWFSAVAGSLAGFGTMVGNAGGPVMNLYLLSRGLRKEHFVGTCAWFFFLVNFGKALPYGYQGMITAKTLQFNLWMAPAVLAGGAAGLWALPRISQRAFNGLAWVLTGAAALWLIVGG